MGLAPTHKAVSELKDYEERYTVKGFLFQKRAIKNSLIVVDEAGMLSNNDYLELLKVVKENNCQIILQE
ncbi:AAA family ATPase [Candidatus Orientia mediorientalis]|uniref:AAA family ATPase n=1 Tax=Candidatus Orientia mediorientalis TaxID=911112 RepID=UPI000A0526E3